MTCEEFDRLTRDNPDNSTRAQRAAAAEHYHSCQSCQDEIDRVAEKYEQSCSPDELSELNARADMLNMAMTQGDYADPEFRSGFTNINATVGDKQVNLKELLAIDREMREKDDANNAGLVASLNKFIDRYTSGSVAFWADQLKIHPAYLLDVLFGVRKPSWTFWEAIQVYFDPLRGK